MILTLNPQLKEVLRIAWLIICIATILTILTSVTGCTTNSTTGERISPLPSWVPFIGKKAPVVQDEKPDRWKNYHTTALWMFIVGVGIIAYGGTKSGAGLTLAISAAGLSLYASTAEELIPYIALILKVGVVLGSIYFVVMFYLKTIKPLLDKKKTPIV